MYILSYHCSHCYTSFSAYISNIALSVCNCILNIFLYLIFMSYRCSYCCISYYVVILNPCVVLHFQFIMVCRIVLFLIFCFLILHLSLQCISRVITILIFSVIVFFCVCHIFVSHAPFISLFVFHSLLRTFIPQFSVPIL